VSEVQEECYCSDVICSNVRWSQVTCSDMCCYVMGEVE
jgi:hypothetical protein